MSFLTSALRGIWDQCAVLAFLLMLWLFCAQSQAQCSSDAGPDQPNVCGLHTTMNAKAPDKPHGETGLWTKLDGPGALSFSDLGDPDAIVTAYQAGKYTLVWTIQLG